MPVSDPSKVRGSGEEVLAAFRNARKEIEKKVGILVNDILKKA